MELTPVSVTGFLLLSSTLIYIFVVASKKMGFKKDTTPEPYRILSIIPYIGHLVGLIWYRNRYYSKLRYDQCVCFNLTQVSEQLFSARYDNLPIYTLPILNGQIYVINEPNLVLAAQRQPKIISVWQVEATATAALGALSTTASNKLKSNLCPRHDEDTLQGKGLLLEGLNATHQAMAPGPGFQQMLLAASQTIAEDLNALSEKGAAQRRVDLWQWVKHEVTHATTESVYGPMNPYRDLAVENGFWYAWSFLSTPARFHALLLTTRLKTTGILPMILCCYSAARHSLDFWLQKGAKAELELLLHSWNISASAGMNLAPTSSKLDSE